ncbi:hypothetical protein GCM10010532_099310 [Dactylosporangium siamense]|uniref:Uncharacterized protein n=1 Tax=Dactylosporangium siamense TaxID=685454 RepID=A0A919PXT6_9ACTN|nr:hypothetical protein Dsi01nite_092720 [Dactylosporangium siamense]
MLEQVLQIVGRILKVLKVPVAAGTDVLRPRHIKAQQGIVTTGKQSTPRGRSTSCRSAVRDHRHRTGGTWCRSGRNAGMDLDNRQPRAIDGTAARRGGDVRLRT